LAGVPYFGNNRSVEEMCALSSPPPDSILGYPKPITYTHQMMAIPDTAARLEGIRESYTHQYAFRRWYTPLPVLHVRCDVQKK